MEDNRLYRIRTFAFFLVCVVFMSGFLRFLILEFTWSETNISEIEEVETLEEVEEVVNNEEEIVSNDKLPQEAQTAHESIYKGNQLTTGASPYDDYFGSGVYDNDYRNEITFENGQSSDVIVCLMRKYYPYNAIRNEYIRAGESFKMTNIPNGIYYIKSFYGNDWNPNLELIPRLKGGFETSRGFTKSDNEDDLIELVQNDFQYSTYTITLYSVSNGNMESEDISLSEFFNDH